jgi:hypothetical protein
MGSNYEYRETFKQSLRKYEIATTQHNLPRVQFSAVPLDRKTEDLNETKFRFDLARAS